MSTATSTAQRRGLLDRILGRSASAARAPSAAGWESENASGAPEVGMVTPVDPRRREASAPAVRHTWATLTARVRDVTKATAVLAVDDQGLVFVSTGEMSDHELNGIAAHVALAFDLFERLTVLGTKTESVCAQYVPDGTWLTAIRMRPPIGPRMTIAIVGPYTLVREDRRRIRDAFVNLFEQSELTEPE